MRNMKCICSMQCVILKSQLLVQIAVRIQDSADFPEFPSAGGGGPLRAFPKVIIGKGAKLGVTAADALSPTRVKILPPPPPPLSHKNTVKHLEIV
jgi:hypothetical protein